MIQKVEISWRHGDQEGAIPVEVVYSKRRTIGLEIKADGHVYARVPVRIPNQLSLIHISVQPASSGPGDREAQEGGGTLSVRPGGRAGY